MKTRFMKLVTVMAMILSFIGFSFAQNPTVVPTLTGEGVTSPTDWAPESGVYKATIPATGASLNLACTVGTTGNTLKVYYVTTGEDATDAGEEVTLAEGVGVIALTFAENAAESKINVLVNEMGEEESGAKAEVVKASTKLAFVFTKETPAATLTLTPKLMNGSKELTLEEPTQYIKQWVGLNVPSTAVLKLTCSDEDATILYSVDGTEPSESYTEAGIELADVLAAATQDVAAQIKAKATKGEAEVTIEVELYPEPVRIPLAIAAILSNEDGDYILEGWTKNGNPGDMGMENWPAPFWGDGKGVYEYDSVGDGWTLAINPMSSSIMMGISMPSIYYTTDGSEPTEKDSVWEEDLELVFPTGKNSLVLKVLVIEKDGEGKNIDTATAQFAFVRDMIMITPILADVAGPLDLIYADGKYSAKDVDTTGATLTLACDDADAEITYTLNDETEVKTYTDALKVADLFADSNAVTITATTTNEKGIVTTVIIELKARELTADFMLAYMYWNWPYEATPEDWTADEKGFYNSTIYAIEDPAPALLFECSPKKVGNTVKVHYAFDKAATAADATMKEDFFSGKFKLNLAFAEGKDTIELHVLVAEYEAAADPEAKEDASPVVTLAMKFKFAKNANALVLNTAVYDRYGYPIPQSTWKKDGNPFFPLGDLDEMGDGTGVFEHDSIMNGWFLGINPVGVLTTDTTTYRAFYTTDGSEPAETSTEVELEECSVFRIPAVFGSADQVTYKVLVQEIVGECESSIGPRVGEGTEPDADAEVKVVSFSKMTFTLKKTQEILSFAPEMTSGTMVPFNEKDKKFQIAALTTDSLKLICLGSEKITYKVGAAEAVDYTKPLAVKDLLNGARNVTITAKATNETSGALAAENVIELSQKQVSLSLSLQNGWVPIKITYADGKYSAKDVPDEATLRVSPSPYQSTVTYTLNEETKKDTVKGNLKAADLFGTKDTVTINFKASCEGAIDTAIVVQLIKKPVLLTLTPVVKDGDDVIALTKLAASAYNPYDFYKAEVDNKDLTVTLESNKQGATIKYVAKDITAFGETKEITETYSGPISVKDLFDQYGELTITAAVKLGEETDTIQVRLNTAPEPEVMRIMAGLYNNNEALTDWTKNGNPSQEDMGSWVDPDDIKGGDATGVYAYDNIEDGSVLKVSLLYTGFNNKMYYTLDGTEAGETSTEYTDFFNLWDQAGITLRFPEGKDTLRVNVFAKDAAEGSDVTATAKFTFTKKGAVVVVAKPTINPNGGEVVAGTKVTLACTTTGSTIYYTTNGDEPTNASTRYTDGVTVDKAMTIKAIAYVGESKSEVASAAFTIKATTVEVAKPTFNPAAGAVVAGTKVEIKCTTTGSKIYYTTDGTTPTDKSTEYKEAITIDKAMTIKAIAYVGEDKSEVAEAAYTIKVGIEGKELAGVSVYPNPNDGEFYVTVPVNATVEVFAVNGKQVANMTVSAGKSLVRLNNAGIYFVRVRANGQDAIRKVVVR